jgi:hypothetical protein
MSVDCTCADWDENIAKLNAPILLQTARSGGSYQYSGKKFVYCPWCGKSLTGAANQPTVDPDKRLGDGYTLNEHKAKNEAMRKLVDRLADQTTEGP